MIPLIDRLRFRLAFTRQRRAAWRNGLATAGLIAGLLIAHGIVGRIDYEEELRQAAAAQQTRADRNRAALLACINQGAPGLYIERANGVRDYLVCGAPYYVSDENITGRKAM